MENKSSKNTNFNKSPKKVESKPVMQNNIVNQNNNKNKKDNSKTKTNIIFATLGLLIAGLAGSTAYFAYKAFNNTSTDSHEVIVDPASKDADISEITDLSNGDKQCTVKSDKDIESVEVSIGKNKLIIEEDYKIETVNANGITQYRVTIYKVAIDKYSGSIIITPIFVGGGETEEKVTVVFEDNNGSLLERRFVKGKSCKEMQLEDPTFKLPDNSHISQYWYYNNGKNEKIEFNEDTIVSNTMLVYETLGVSVEIPSEIKVAIDETVTVTATVSASHGASFNIADFDFKVELNNEQGEEVPITYEKHLATSGNTYSIDITGVSVNNSKPTITPIVTNGYQGLTHSPQLIDVYSKTADIDWLTSTIKNGKTLYDLAKDSTKIVIGTNEKYKTTAESLSSVVSYDVDEEKKGTIKAYYGDNASSKKELYILSDKVIRFEDDDLMEESGKKVAFFYRCKIAEEIILENIDTSKVTSFCGLFCMCSKLKSIDLSNLNTKSITDMSHMFNSDKVLENIVFGKNFNTSGVLDMSYMFLECEKLTSVDLSSFDTSSVLNMSLMFRESSLKSLDLSNFNTSSVTTMESMFEDTELTSIDLSNFDTSSVTDMSSMFASSKLTSLDLSNFDTSSTMNMSSMFQYTQLTSLDLSSFNTSSVTTMKSMFEDSKYLTKIIVSDKFVTSKITETGESCSTNMFNNCLVLVGGNGTSYVESNPKDKTYAHIDGGTGNPGYFTAK